MQIQTRRYEERCVKIVEDVCPEGYVEIDNHVPASCPWDCYGRKHQREYCLVLENAGIECIPLVTRREHLCPTGSGPGGRVRFGDSSMPYIYRIAVKSGEEEHAFAAFKAHKQALQDWLDGKRDIPNECRG